MDLPPNFFYMLTANTLLLLLQRKTGAKKVFAIPLLLRMI